MRQSGKNAAVLAYALSYLKENEKLLIVRANPLDNVIVTRNVAQIEDKTGEPPCTFKT